MWILCDDSQDDHSQLILQCKTLLYWNSRREPLQASVDIQHHLVVFRVAAQLFQCWHWVTLLTVDAEKQRPHTSPQVICNFTQGGNSILVYIDVMQQSELTIDQTVLRLGKLSPLLDRCVGILESVFD